MNVQSMEVTRHRTALYRRTMHEAGFDDESIARNLEQCWVWRNVFVAESDAEAERLGVPAFAAMVESRAALRNRIYRETALRIEVPAADLPSARGSVEHGFIHGSPRRSRKSRHWVLAALSRVSASARWRTKQQRPASLCSCSRWRHSFTVGAHRPW